MSPAFAAEDYPPAFSKIVPLPPGAEVMLSGANGDNLVLMLALKQENDTAAVAGRYRESLVNRGWTFVDQTQDGDMRAARYAKQGQELLVSVVPELKEKGGGVLVNLTLSPMTRQ